MEENRKEQGVSDLRKFSFLPKPIMSSPSVPRSSRRTEKLSTGSEPITPFHTLRMLLFTVQLLLDSARPEPIFSALHWKLCFIAGMGSW